MTEKKRQSVSNTAKSGRSGTKTQKLQGAREARASSGRQSVKTKQVPGARSMKEQSRSRQTTAVQNAQDRRASGKKSSSAKKSGSSGNRDYEYYEMNEARGLGKDIYFVVAVLISVLCILSYIGIAGSFGTVINTIVFGIFGSFGYVFPFVFLGISAYAVFARRSELSGAKITGVIFMVIFIAALIQLAVGGYDSEVKLLDNFSNSVPGYAGEHRTYGGLFGGALVSLMYPVLGKAPSVLVLIALIIILLILVSGKAIFSYIRDISANRLDARRERKNREYEEVEFGDETEEDYFEERYYDETEVSKRRIRFRSPIVIEKVDEIEDDLIEIPIQKPEKRDFVDDLRMRGSSVVPDNKQSASKSAEVKKAAIDLEEIGENRMSQDNLDSELQKSLANEASEALEEDEFFKQELNRKYGGRKQIDVAQLRKSEYADSIVIGKAEEIGPFFDDPDDDMPSVEFLDEPDNIVRFPSADATVSQEERESFASIEPEAEDEFVPKAASKAEHKDIGDELVINEEPAIKKYVFPPIDLLKKGNGQSKTTSDNELRATALKLEETFESFGVGVTVTDVSCGPTVTRYELHPEQGVKVSRITALADDIKLNLAAADIRIEAPIPGKAAVGIEIPNKENTVVLFRDLIETKEFDSHKSNIAFAVGKDIGGKTVVTDIAKMPHLLIAGATGSGKSVCINTLIMSILYKAKPEDVKLIMVDPKVVELNIYNGIPHLLIPVVTDPKKASAALNWAVLEMTNRYKLFAEAGVRDLSGYNERAEEEMNRPKVEGEPTVLLNKLPQIVIIVDELADLMMVAPGEVEDSICRLAQLARAAGIHLVIATQRPSVNVITGLIKANVPSRIAFAVSSAIDSRTIIDGGGAEKLLGRGDMLFFPAGYPKPVRLQGAFVSDKEVSDVVNFLKAQCEESPKYNEDITKQIETAQTETVKAVVQEASGNDEYFAEAGKFIIEKEKASIGLLQRVYKIGFNRAARIMDQLAEAGVVGPEEGTKPRKILMTMEEFEQYLLEHE